MRYLCIVLLLATNINSYSVSKLMDKEENTIKDTDIKTLEAFSPQETIQKENTLRFTSKPVKCKKEEVKVTIHNTSNNEMYFEDITQKMAIIIAPKTNRILCLNKGDVIDGSIKHVKIVEETLPVKKLMHYTESLDINIDKDGHIHVKASTRPH